MNCNKDNSRTVGSQRNVVINTPYGELRLGEDNAHDHARMKARELTAFLRLVSGEGQEIFAGLDGDLQNSLLWMLSQAAGELDELLSQVKFAEAEVTK